MCKPKNNDNGFKLSNCKIANNANDDNNCNTCDDGYSLVNNQGCVKGNIANCKTYSTSTSENLVKCLTCNNGYWLKTTVGTSCEKGKIPFCDVYASEKECSECQANYWLLISAAGKNSAYCLPKDTASACKVATFSTQTDSTAGKNPMTS